MSAVLEFDGVSASYAGATVLRDVSFSIDEGETVAMVGRNGAGKSTALLSVYGIPTVHGVIRLGGAPLGRRRHEPAAAGISLVPQGKRIFPNLTVEENIQLGRAARRKGEWTLERIYDLFPNLRKAAKRKGTALSGGEQQMLAIARALVAEPRLLMLDEPTEGLAPIIIEQLATALTKIRDAGTGLLLVEQRIPLVQMLASRFLALRKGELVTDGPVSDLQRPDVQEVIAL